MTTEALPQQWRDDPPIPCRPLPSMFDLPSEHPDDPGLPDEFHDQQPQLLDET